MCPYLLDAPLQVLEDLDIPKEISDMFISIPEDKFRVNISSTELRKKQGDVDKPLQDAGSKRKRDITTDDEH